MSIPQRKLSHRLWLLGLCLLLFGCGAGSGSGSNSSSGASGGLSSSSGGSGSSSGGSSSGSSSGGRPSTDPFVDSGVDDQGRFDGAATLRDQQGRTIATGHFTSGVRTGLWRIYDSEGHLRWEGYYMDGSIDQTQPWKEWNADGSIRTTSADLSSPGP